MLESSRHVRMWFGVATALAVVAACGGNSNPEVDPPGSITEGGTAGTLPTGGTGGTEATGGTTSVGGTGGTAIVIDPDAGGCPTITCASLGWACGYTIDECDKVVNCADEGLMCAVTEVCTGGIDGPTTCVTGGAGVCPVCSGIPDCSTAPQKTMLSGRVITPGRDDTNLANQVGVPNATVYLLRTPSVTDLPEIPTGIPAGGMSCDKCDW